MFAKPCLSNKDSRVSIVAMDDDDLNRRAWAAYFRTGGGTDQPRIDSRVVELDGKRYVLLHNVNDILAVYRVRNDGMLRRMRRWPSELGG